jgi:hypothetical protein
MFNYQQNVEAKYSNLSKQINMKLITIMKLFGSDWRDRSQSEVSAIQEHSSLYILVGG